MKKVLVVDDNASDRQLMCRALHGQYEVLEASNGREALGKALRHHPDVILMDIIMPGLSGLEAIRALQREPTTSDIPVVIVSTKNSDLDREWGLRQKGVVEYLFKPFSPAQIQRCVEHALAGR